MSQFKYKVGDKIIITNPHDASFGVVGTITSVHSKKYFVKWEDEDKVFGYERLGHFCRKLTKLEKALK